MMPAIDEILTIEPPSPVSFTVLAIAGIAQAFTHVVTLDDVRAPKPAPDPYLLAAELFGYDPARCLVFEDTGIGAQAGEAAGMQVCMVKEGKPVGLTY